MKAFGWRLCSLRLSSPTLMRRLTPSLQVLSTVSRTGSLLGVAPDANRDIDERELLPLIWAGPDADKKDAE